MQKKIFFVFFLLLFSNLVFAQTQELTNLIKAYFDATQKKDSEAVMNTYFYPEGITEEFKANEKQNIQARIDRQALQNVEFTFVSEEIFNQRKNAYVEINITEGTILNDNRQRVDLKKETQYFVFEKQGIHWKILNNSVKSEDFNPAQKEEYIDYFKETFFASIQQQGGFKPGYDGTQEASNQNEGIGILDMLIGAISIGIIIVILLIIFFSVTGKDKKKGQNVVVNVNSNGSQPTKKQETQKKMKALGVKLNPETKKEFSDAMKILRKRYATGEINKQQFDEIKKELGE